MNLYEILFSHTSPKDTEIGIKTYLLAENDGEVYDFINEKYNYGCWKDKEEENEMFEIYNDECEVIGEQSFREKIISLKGEMYDDEYDYDYSNAYYGIKLYGWGLIKKGIEINLGEIVKLGIIKRFKKEK